MDILHLAAPYRNVPVTSALDRMFSLFRRKYRNGVLVISENEFWDRLGSECASRAFFDAQGEEHGHIDMRLVTKIEDHLVPVLGRWERTTNWFHQLDYYGDGIRSLSFSRPYFRSEFVDQLQQLLTGEHEPFCILCQVHEDFGSESDTRIGSAAIFAQRLMVSRKLAQLLALAV